MQQPSDPHSRLAANSRTVGNMFCVVRRALREKGQDTTLRRRILSEARRVGFDANSGVVAGDEIIWTVAQRLSAYLAGVIQTPLAAARGVEETIRD